MAAPIQGAALLVSRVPDPKDRGRRSGYADPMRRLLLILIVSTLALLTACSGGADAGEVEQRIADGAVVIDVRTPAEYEAGHLDDALNIDFNAPDFKGQIGKLDRDGSYVVYCKSGNRSGQAKAVMDQMGFTDVYDGGAYSDLR